MQVSRAPSGRQTAPAAQPSDSPSVASTRSHSATGPSPAARWSAIACWALSSLCAPPTRRRIRACSSSRVSTGASWESVDTLGTPAVRVSGETTMKGRCGSVSRTSASAFWPGTACGPPPP